MYHTIKYCLYIKRNEVLIHTTEWINLEKFTLSERRQTHRPHIMWFHLYEISRISKSMEKRKKISGCLDLGELEGMRGDC